MSDWEFFSYNFIIQMMKNVWMFGIHFFNNNSLLSSNMYDNEYDENKGATTV